jgi:ABC-type antimicrobial peptide transport system permease subunit
MNFQIWKRKTRHEELDTEIRSHFAVLALLLAVTGLYGVVSHGVGRRTREIGIRMALGAQPREVLRLVIAQGLRPALAGVALGLAGALVMTRVLGSLLYEVRASDPATYLAVSVILISTVAIACYAPARRATKTDPVIALRTE